MQDPNSLSTQLLKAIYIPDTYIFEVELGPNPSQIWLLRLVGRDESGAETFRLFCGKMET
jgi:hypothetical protein